MSKPYMIIAIIVPDLNGFGDNVVQYATSRNACYVKTKKKTKILKDLIYISLSQVLHWHCQWKDNWLRYY